MAARRSVKGSSRVVARGIGDGEPLSVERLLAAPVRWPKPSRLGSVPTRIRGLGPATAAALESELGITSIEDLLLHFPRAFSDALPLVAMSELALGQEAAIEGIVGTVGRFEPRGPRRRGRSPGRLVVTLRDASGSGSIKAIWFNQPWLSEQLRPQMRLRLTGKLERPGFVVSSHEQTAAVGAATAPATLNDPARRFWRRDESVPSEIHTRAPVPVHPASDRLSAKQLRRFIWQALSHCEDRVQALPARIRVGRGLPDAAAALRATHFPALVGGETPLAREALALEELVLHQLVLARRRHRRQELSAHRLPPAAQGYHEWLSRLPFELTGDQARALDEIGADLESGRPMQRLLMGEVGSGKTVVALAAMMRAILVGAQAAMMAPTEVLAEQHAATIERLLAGTGVECGLLTGSTPETRRRDLLARLADGRLQLIVGTHALLEDRVGFADLAIAVVDEQHRFGVRQRQLLDEKGSGGLLPHRLHMSATPIPRTLALLGYGDLDLSELRELPAGRRPIETRLVEPADRGEAFERLRESLRDGRQAYVICPLVTESEALQARAALVEAERLANADLKGFRVAVLHGRMAAEDKRRTMQSFAAGDVDVLVATTVVEVGVDVANATTILIEGAERFGLAQLHQLRGRVGRGEHSSQCLLLPGELGHNARRRLSALVAHADGFRLAELDLLLRGAGEVLGARQSGLPEFKAAKLPEDAGLLVEARRLATEILDSPQESVPGSEFVLEIAESRFAGVSEQVIAA